MRAIRAFKVIQGHQGRYQSKARTECDFLLVINSNWHPISYRSELSQLIVHILNTLRFSAPFGGIGITYDVHLRLIGKRVVDFLLVLIEVFSLDVTAEALRAKIDRKSILFQRGHFDPKFHVQWVAPHQSFSHG